MTDNIYFVTAAYAVTWIVVLGYLMRLHTANRRAQAAYDHATSTGGAAK